MHFCEFLKHLPQLKQSKRVNIQELYILKKLLCLSALNVFANFIKYVHDKRFNERPVVLLTSIFDSNMGMITKNSIHRK